METKFFELKNSENIDEIVEKIKAAFITSQEKPKIYKQKYFDTFDWRLLTKDLTLSKDKQTFYLINLKDYSSIDKQVLKNNNQYYFCNDFPDGTFKNKLSSYLDIRALIPLIIIENHESIIKILDQNDKTVARACFYKTYKINGNQKSFFNNELLILPIRGYSDVFNNLYDFLISLGLTPTSKNIIFTILNDEREKSGNYTGKQTFRLSNDLSGIEAAKIIFTDLLQTVKQNESGIKKDIDSEFLHDFRVAVRRIRSALSQIKGIYPENEVKRLKKDFSIIGKNTNRLRDLDVYLLEEKKYLNMLSDDLSKGLIPVFKKLAAERRTEQKKLKKFLESYKYKNTVSGFEKFLKTSTSLMGNAPNSELKVIDLAQKFIFKKYKQIIKKGRKIDNVSPDPMLHELRIECKKLRYLLEFFSSLFPDNEMSIIIKQLKKLQDNLGDFNDLYIQQQSLKNMVKEFDESNSEIKQVSISIGGLITVLHQKQKEVKNRFSKSFSEFDSKKNEKLFFNLFANNGKPGK